MNCLEAITASTKMSSSSASGREGRGLVVAAIGSGGKSTLLRSLADEMVAAGHTAILSTTTHFLPFEGIMTVGSESEFEIGRRLESQRVICAAMPATSAKDAGKLGPSPVGAERLATLADYVLVEADGSRRLPLKAHAGHEPVVPTCTDVTALLLGATGFGKPVEEATHRPEVYCELAGCAASDVATPELVAKAIVAEVANGTIAPTLVVVNQAESEEAKSQAAALAHALAARDVALPVYAGSVRSHSLEKLG